MIPTLEITQVDAEWKAYGDAPIKFALVVDVDSIPQALRVARILSTAVLALSMKGNESYRRILVTLIESAQGLEDLTDTPEHGQYQQTLWAEGVASRRALWHVEELCQSLRGVWAEGSAFGRIFHDLEWQAEHAHMAE